jgi:cytochrome P450
MRATFSAYQTRLSLEHNVLSDGTESYPGQEPRAEYPKVNRDPDVFGPDAMELNPNRPPPADGTRRYGLGFGVGTRQCFGLRVVVGNDGKGGAHVEPLRILSVPAPGRPYFS